jgi:hypothetical protein
LAQSPGQVKAERDAIFECGNREMKYDQLKIDFRADDIKMTPKAK